MTDILPELITTTEVTGHSLLDKAIAITLKEYSEYYLSNIKQIYDTLVYIRIGLEPIFITDEKQLKGVYNTIRDSVDTISRKQSAVPMRFLNTVYARWLAYVSDELGINVEKFIRNQASALSEILTSQINSHTRVDDTLGETLKYDDWKDWLVDCPIFILIFTMKHIDSDYLDQTQQFVALYEKTKNDPKYIPEA